jgi:hypothetical protein
MKLVERMLRVCKAVIKAKVAILFFNFYFTFILLGKSVKNKFLFSMTA